MDENAGGIPQICANLELDSDVPDAYSPCMKMLKEFIVRYKRAGMYGYFEKNHQKQCITTRLDL